MKITKVSPNKIIFQELTDVDLAVLQANCKYHDKRVDSELLRFKRAIVWFVSKYGESVYYSRLEELKRERYKSVLFQDEDGTYWTYAGLAEKLSQIFNCSVRDMVEYPESQLIPWDKPLDFTLYPYQEEAINKLLEKKHAGVSMATGLGKSACIISLCKRLGLKTIVMAPSKNIAKQLHKSFRRHFGVKYVGFYGDGKKEPAKRFVVGIAASLTKVDEDHPDWKHLSTVQVFISDEAHLTPASTFEKVVSRIAQEAPYRFFFSGTQMRTDGLGIVLEGITGPLVTHMTVRDGVEGGYLSKPVFKMIEVPSFSRWKNQDVNKMTRKHLYYNENVLSRAASLINHHVSEGKPTLVLIEELEQFTRLLPFLKHEARFAHGAVTAATKEKIPPEYQKSDVEALVDEFNDGKSTLLIGTSCISIGTDIRAAQVLVFLQGGISEINVRQSIGRGTRLYPGKKECLVYDFDITNIDSQHRHATIRRSIYDDIYGPTKYFPSNLEAPDGDV